MKEGSDTEFLKGIYHAFLNGMERRELDDKDRKVPKP